MRDPLIMRLIAQQVFPDAGDFEREIAEVARSTCRFGVIGWRYSILHAFKLCFNCTGGKCTWSDLCFLPSADASAGGPRLHVYRCKHTWSDA